MTPVHVSRFHVIWQPLHMHHAAATCTPPRSQVEIHMLTEFLYFCTETYEPQDVLSAEIRICSALQAAN